jgi:hypothetical protein
MIIAALLTESLVIKISRHGKDEAECLSGKIPCKTFDYARGVDGNNGDVTMIITYPQHLFYNGKVISIGNNINSLNIVGQVRDDDYTFICNKSDLGVSIYNVAQYLYFENIRCKCPLVISAMFKVQFKGYYNPRDLELFNVALLTIEDSTLAGLHYSSSWEYQSMKIRNSSFINNDTILDLDYSTSDPSRPLLIAEIIIENTSFKFVPGPSPNQPPYVEISFDDVATVNVSVSKCDFYNHNSTILAIDASSSSSSSNVKESDVYLGIIDSNLHVPPANFSGNMVTTQIGAWQANVRTWLSGNKLSVT